MKNSQHLGAWFAIIILGFLLGPLMRSGSSLEAFVVDEIRLTREALGETVAEKVVSFAGGLFEDTPLGMVAQTAKTAQHTSEERQLSKKVAGPGGEIIAGLYNSYLQGLVLQSYVVAMRLAILLVWLVILLPMLYASVFDGFMQRRIKRAEFGAIRPATFTVAGMVVIPLLCLPLVYLVIPFSMSPLLAPAWAFFVALPLSLLVSNMQPLFGR